MSFTILRRKRKRWTDIDKEKDEKTCRSGKQEERDGLKRQID